MVPEGGHDRSGYPYFKGWPRHTSLSHQQMYVDWLKRAWQGGLRLVHMDVLSNPIMAWAYKTTSVLLGGNKTPNPVDEEWNIDRQIKAARAFAKMPDVKDWLAIATSASEAEAIVREGKLAVVLGVEADNLGGFTMDPGFRALAAKAKAHAASKNAVRKKLRAYLKKLHGLGVRHVFPVHVFDNVFGGAAVYDLKLDAGNYLFHGFGGNGYKFFETTNLWKGGAEGEGIFVREDVEVREIYEKVVEYLKMGQLLAVATKPEVLVLAMPIVLPILVMIPVVNLALPALTLLPTVHLLTKGLLELEKKIGVQKLLKSRLDAFPAAPGKARLGIANKHGLSAAGEIFVEEAMRLGMVIDLAHMSERSTNRTLDIAEACRYPIISGHTGFRETSFGTWTNRKPRFVGGAVRFTNELGYFDDPVPNNDVGWSHESRARLGTANPELLAAERSLSRKQLRRIRDLGGLVGLGTGNGAQPRMWVEKKQTPIAPDCDGTTKSWVQQYRYALQMMKDKNGRVRGGIALGTDANGFVSMLGPRFGPLACTASFSDEVRGGATVVAQANARRNGVRYANNLNNGVRYWDKERFGGASTLEVLPPYPDGFWKFMGDLLSGGWHDLRPATTKIIEDHRAIWTGLARFYAGAAPSSHWGCATDGRGVERDAYRYAWGFWLAANNQPRPTCDCGGLRDPFSSQGCTGGDTNADSKSSWDVYHHRPQSEWWDPGSGRTARVQRIYEKWRDMVGKNEPLEKSVVKDGKGKVTRDFDYNLDGLAHYGMLPDMLQDAKNLGLSKHELATLFSGVDAYVSMWKRIEARSAELKGDGALVCKR
jgi:microsomal dipeptidase-like Zn-dependent dipeptidase